MVLQKPLTPFTENTITDAPALRIELEEIRARGYSIDDEEVESGAKCIGAPIFDYLREPVAALSVSGPVSRINRQQNEIIKAVTAGQKRSAARSASRRRGRIKARETGHAMFAISSSSLRATYFGRCSWPYLSRMASARASISAASASRFIVRSSEA